VTRQQLLELLHTTPDRVGELARDLTPSQLARPPAAGEWSMGQILDHLLHGERDVILPRLRRMRTEEAPAFPSSAPDRIGFAAKPRGGDFAADLSAFRGVRQATVTFLQELSDPEWQRLGSTPTRGKLSIDIYARDLVDHDPSTWRTWRAFGAAMAPD
jgi:DinB superfamily